MQPTIAAPTAISIFVLFFLLSLVHINHAENEPVAAAAHKMAQTGWFANDNPDKKIVIDGRFFKDPPGGVEAMIQLSLAMQASVNDPSQVHIKFPGEVFYHKRWIHLFGADKLIRRSTNFHELKPGDIFIYNEGLPCYAHLPKGVHVFVYVLADYIGCRSGVRYISHNQYLSNWTFYEHGNHIKDIILPRERVIHPYLSAPIIERAKKRAALQDDGSILYQQSHIKDVKRNIILIDNDVPDRIHRCITYSIKEINKRNPQMQAKEVMLSHMDHDEIMHAYESGKIVIDWCMRGSERCPMEAALYGAIPVSNQCSTGMGFADFPVPAKYMFEESVRDFNDSIPEDMALEKKIVNHMVELYTDIFTNYWHYVPDFEPYRQIILGHTPEKMVQESRRFLATVDFDQSASLQNSSDSLLPYPCLNC
jgi:hypothetical protein